MMFVPVTARLRDGVTLDAATAEINTLGARLRDARVAPGQPARFEVIGEHDQMVAGVRPALRVLVVSVAVVFLIVCANVSDATTRSVSGAGSGPRVAASSVSC
jgi:hypothetical protein